MSVVVTERRHSAACIPHSTCLCLSSGTGRTRVTATRREVMAGGAALASVGFATRGQSRIISPSPEWTQILPPAPVNGTKITPEYAELVGRDAYFWAWPLVNVYIRRLVHEISIPADKLRILWCD